MPEKPDTTNDKRLNVRLDPETHRALRMKAAEEDKSIQDLVEDWLRSNLGLPPKTGSKGGVVYARGGMPAPRFADGRR